MPRGHHVVPWSRVEVGDDDRSIALSGLELPEGGPWRLERVRLEEHPEAVVALVAVTDAPPVRDIAADLPATKRLRAPLGGRPVLDGSLGRLVSPDPVSRHTALKRHPWRELDASRPGVVVVCWSAPIFVRLARAETDGDAGVTLWTWEAGGKLGREDRLTVVPRSDPP